MAPRGPPDYDGKREATQSPAGVRYDGDARFAVLFETVAMKTRHDILIDAPRDVVWAAFDDPANMPRWQPTLAKYTHVSGTPGRPGAVAELVYDEKGREVRIAETITERREPDVMAGVYTSDWGKTIIVNHFEDAGDDKTRWVVYSNHFFNGMMKLLGLFFAGSIRKRTANDLERFKLLVESEREDETP